MVEIGAIASADTNLTSGGAAPVDLSYHPYPGRNEAAGAGEAVMSFSDFLDMINPLQHIPLVSSIYRAATGETINPVSRIAGDILYGGAIGVGLASAGIAAVGAVGDEVVAANNGGQSAAMMVASLFGNDDTPTTQLASATTPNTDSAPTTSQIQVAGLQSMPGPQQSVVAEIPSLTSAAPSVAPMAIAQAAVAPDVVVQTASATNAPAPVADNGAAGKSIPLDRSKQPYGGVMDTALMQSAQQNQTLALAMAGTAGAMQAQHNLRNNRFMTSNTVSPVLSGSATNPMTSAAITPAAMPKVATAPQTEAALQNLIAELQASKGINQYKNAAQSTPAAGSTVNITN